MGMVVGDSWASLSFVPLLRVLTIVLHSPYPGTSPHVVTNVSVVPLPKSANVSWEPGFDGGYLQRFSIWYTPLCVTFPATALLPILILSGPLPFVPLLHPSPAPILLLDFQES